MGLLTSCHVVLTRCHIPVRECFGTEREGSFRRVPGRPVVTDESSDREVGPGKTSMYGVWCIAVRWYVRIVGWQSVTTYGAKRCKTGRHRTGVVGPVDLVVGPCSRQVLLPPVQGRCVASSGCPEAEGAEWSRNGRTSQITRGQVRAC
jgi:hypothetical protein